MDLVEIPVIGEEEGKYDYFIYKLER